MATPQNNNQEPEKQQKKSNSILIVGIVILILIILTIIGLSIYFLVYKKSKGSSIVKNSSPAIDALRNS